MRGRRNWEEERQEGKKKVDERKRERKMLRRVLR